LLNRAPRLKWFTVEIRSNQELLPNLEKTFGPNEWLNLQGVCIHNEKDHMEDMFPDQVPAVQQACPNATIHIKFKGRKKYDSRLLYGTNLSPQCSRACYKCIPNWSAYT
jgi:hypothetical protein